VSLRRQPRARQRAEAEEPWQSWQREAATTATVGGLTLGEAVDVPEIERLLDYRTLVPNSEVEASLAELDALACAELEATRGSSRHTRGLTRLTVIREYWALRLLARQQGWTAPLEENDWPLRPEAGGPTLPPHAPAELAEAETVLVERLQAIKAAQAHAEAPDEAKTAVTTHSTEPSTHQPPGRRIGGRRPERPS
jgi:hypothetical protein